MNASPSAVPVVYAYDPRRSQVSQFPLVIPEAQLVFTRSFNRSRQGEFAVVGGAVSREGSTAPFRAVLHPGVKLGVVRLNSFYPQQVVIADDSTLWVAGVEESRGGEAPCYCVLRR